MIADGADALARSSGPGRRRRRPGAASRTRRSARERAVDAFDRHRPVDGERLQRQREKRPCVGAEGRGVLTGAAGDGGGSAQPRRSFPSSYQVEACPRGTSVRKPAFALRRTLLVVDERQFFTEKPEQRPARFQCPRCRRTNDYSIGGCGARRKRRLPAGADERDRALFAKSQGPPRPRG